LRLKPAIQATSITGRPVDTVSISRHRSVRHADLVLVMVGVRPGTSGPQASEQDVSEAGNLVLIADGGVD
jgi:hypothetical protein